MFQLNEMNFDLSSWVVQRRPIHLYVFEPQTLRTHEIGFMGIDMEPPILHSYKVWHNDTPTLVTSKSEANISSGPMNVDKSGLFKQELVSPTKVLKCVVCPRFTKDRIFTCRLARKTRQFFGQHGIILRN